MIGTTKIISAEKIIGCRVTNASGENLGKIENLAMDMRRGHIAYGVLSFGGFMGLGDKLFAVPWQAFRPSLTENEFQLDVSKEVFKNAEGFDKNQWPDMTRDDWATRVHNLYGVPPYWERY